MRHDPNHFPTQHSKIRGKLRTHSDKSACLRKCPCGAMICYQNALVSGLITESITKTTISKPQTKEIPPRHDICIMMLPRGCYRMLDSVSVTVNDAGKKTFIVQQWNPGRGSGYSPHSLRVTHCSEFYCHDMLGYADGIY